MQIMKKSRLTMMFILLLSCVCGLAQEQQPKVMSMTETMDIIAGDDQRRDLNNQLCALVKVQVVDEITDVEGNVVGDIVNRGVEKWVYMAKGSRNMKIHFKSNLPVLVKFRDYKITALNSNRVYALVIQAKKADVPTSTVKSNYLSMEVMPANANVTIWGDDLPRKVYRPQADGTLRLLLPYGRYHYLVKANGYHDDEGSVFVNDEYQMETVSLAAIEGSLIMSCPTKKADFYVDGRQIEKGKDATSWTGQLIPGKHQVEVMCKGYVSEKKIVDVQPNQMTRLQFDALQTVQAAKKAEQKKAKDLAKKQKAEEKRQRELAKKSKKDNTNTKNRTIVSNNTGTSKSSKQLKSKADSSKDKLTFGVVAGYNMASASFKDRYGSDVKSQGGFHVGMTMDVPLASNFFFSTGLLYSAKGYQYKSYNDIDEKGNPQYIDVPIQALYRLPLGKSAALRFQAGPYVALCVGGKVTDEWNSYNKLYDESFSSAYTGFDYGLQGGIGFDISGFDIHVAYQMGGAKKYINKNLMIGIGYRF